MLKDVNRLSRVDIEPKYTLLSMVSVIASFSIANRQGGRVPAQPQTDGESAELVGIDTTKPHSARMYDFYLGGKDNYRADREAVVEVEKWFPTVRLCARTNREFMQRATMYLARERGIRQFLDIGTGIPTAPNLHQIAQAVSPDTRVVYVDNDPLVLAHARALLTSSPEGRTAYLSADAANPRAILDSPVLNDVLDLSQPVALSMIAVLHFLADDAAPHDVVSTLTAALAPGSYLVMTHLTADYDPVGIEQAVGVYGPTVCPAKHAAAPNSAGSSTDWTWSSRGSACRTDGASASSRRSRWTCGCPSIPPSPKCPDAGIPGAGYVSAASSATLGGQRSGLTLAGLDSGSASQSNRTSRHTVKTAPNKDIRRNARPAWPRRPTRTFVTTRPYQRTQIGIVRRSLHWTRRAKTIRSESHMVAYGWLRNNAGSRLSRQRFTVLVSGICRRNVSPNQWRCQLAEFAQPGSRIWR